MSKFAAVIKTNVSSRQCPDELLGQTSAFMCQLFKADSKNVVLELHPDTMMMRGGSVDPALNVDIYHNCDSIDKKSKEDFAKSTAKFLSNQTRIPQERILVLFFDTRKCS